ncbi:MAG: hypothetical protein M0036_10430 [Desulfobacteraceae bacterium]|nr:hypothetical protein [Desulfobacteraceae bacterium]
MRHELWDPSLNWRKQIFIGLVSLLILVSNVWAQSDPAGAILRYRIDALRTTGELSIGEEKLASTMILPLLYEKRQFEVLWTDGARIETMIKLIAASADEGLEPEDYHYSALVGLQTFLEKNTSADILVQADRDMLLTDGLILLAYHLVFGKVDPQKLDPNWNLSREIDHRQGLEVMEEILASNDLPGALERLKPQRPMYGRLKAALAQHRAMAAVHMAESLM